MGDQVEFCKPDLESLRAQAIAQGDAAVLTAINENTALLQQLFDRLRLNGMLVEPESAFDSLDQTSHSMADERALVAIDENARLVVENHRLCDRVKQLEREIDSLRAGSVPLGNPPGRRPGDTPSLAPVAADPQSMTWEQRKQQIIQELEKECLDAKAFLSATGAEDTVATELESDPLLVAIRFVEDICKQRDRLHQAVTQNELELECQIREIETLKDSLRSLQALVPQADDPIEADTPISGFAIQAVLAVPSDSRSESINALLDGDEIIQSEREALARLQETCEQRVREIEIRTSLERARHARQQTELEQKTRSLESQLAELQRQLANNDAPGTGSRWMRKLGLSGGSKE